jgi:hypothetical protein
VTTLPAGGARIFVVDQNGALVAGPTMVAGDVGRVPDVRWPDRRARLHRRHQHVQPRHHAARRDVEPAE